MTNYTFTLPEIEALGPASSDLEWLRKHWPADRERWSLAEALPLGLAAWLLAHTPAGLRLVVGWSCDCAERALPAWTARYPDDDRVATATAVARTYASSAFDAAAARAGASTADRARAGAYAATYAARAATYAARAATYAAADAATYAADCAAEAASYAAYVAAYGADAAAGGAERARQRARLIDLLEASHG